MIVIMFNIPMDKVSKYIVHRFNIENKEYLVLNLSENSYFVKELTPNISIIDGNANYEEVNISVPIIGVLSLFLFAFFVVAHFDAESRWEFNDCYNEYLLGKIQSVYVEEKLFYLLNGRLLTKSDTHLTDYTQLNLVSSYRKNKYQYPLYLTKDKIRELRINKLLE